MNFYDLQQVKVYVGQTVIMLEWAISSEHVAGSVEQFPSVEMEGSKIDFAWNGMSECFVKET